MGAHLIPDFALLLFSSFQLKNSRFAKFLSESAAGLGFQALGVEV